MSYNIIHNHFTAFVLGLLAILMCAITLQATGVIGPTLQYTNSDLWGWRGKINVPVPGNDLKPEISQPGICCEYGDCRVCDPEYPALPTLQDFPGFEPKPTTIIPTEVANPLGGGPALIPTPVVSPPPDVVEPNRPTGNVLTEPGLNVDSGHIPVSIPTPNQECFNFKYTDCGPYWVTPTPSSGGGGGGGQGEITPDNAPSFGNVIW